VDPYTGVLHWVKMMMTGAGRELGFTIYTLIILGTV